MRSKLRAVIGICLWALSGLLPLPAYIRKTLADGTPVRRADHAYIRMLVNDRTAAGMQNAEGFPTITSGSDPMSALSAAAETWSRVQGSAVRFAPLETTPLNADPIDSTHVITFADSPEVRSVVGQAAAVTTLTFSSDGNILDSDILFNPNVLVNGQAAGFSTNLAPGTFDLQAVATHELGHALGLNHSGVASSAMFATTAPQSRGCARLAPDDIAFLEAVYPAPGAAAPGGRIRGAILSGGRGVRGALVYAINPEAGIVLSGLSSLTDGSFGIGPLPPGPYHLYVQPAGGLVTPADLCLAETQVDREFQAGLCCGGNDPLLMAISEGAESQADISVEEGLSPIEIQRLGLAGLGVIRVGPQALTIPAGETAEIFLFGRGIDESITEAHVRLVGSGASIRPGSVKLAPEIISRGMPGLSLTVETAARDAPAEVSIAILKDGKTAVYPGALLIEPGAP